MRRSALLQSELVVVATALDAQTPGLVRSAAALCRRTQRQLCLLHALEPFVERPHSLPFGEPDPLWNTAQAVAHSARTMALGALRDLAASLAPDLDVRTLVVSGKRLDVLRHEPQRLGAGLLIVGAQLSGERGPWRFGLSTATSLLATSSVPVLALDGYGTRSFPSERPRLLLADDLAETSAAAADYAFELAGLLGDTEVRHLHISGVTEEVLNEALTTTLAVSHTPMSPQTGEQSHHALLVGLEKMLKARVHGHLGDLMTADCRYLPEVRAGHMFAELAAAASEQDSDLLVFGRHKLVHTKPFFLGRLPLKAMLGLGRPVLVVPND